MHICTCYEAKLHYYYTSIMATMGTMNAAIAPSSDSIQQLMDNSREYEQN